MLLKASNLLKDDKYDKIFVDLNDDQFCIDLAAKKYGFYD